MKKARKTLDKAIKELGLDINDFYVMRVTADSVSLQGDNNPKVVDKVKELETDLTHEGFVTYKKYYDGVRFDVVMALDIQ